MATTKNTKDKGKDKTPPDPNALRVELQHGDSQSEKLAALATDGALTAITLQAYSGGGKELGVTELLAAMRKAGDETVAGDMGRFERVLTHQFLTLDALFNNLAQRSGRQDSFKGIEVLMRLALKAQSQARATAETLALMKNPMPYIKQANIANGPQQVNNGTPASAGKNQSPPNELLEHQHGNTLDIGTQAAAGLIQGYRGADAAGTQGAVPGAGNGGDPGIDEEPHALHSASQHCQRPPAGQQRHSRERGEKSKSTKRTIGAPAWQHPGHWNAGSGRPS